MILLKHLICYKVLLEIKINKNKAVDQKNKLLENISSIYKNKIYFAIKNKNKCIS